jgi:hypothetical protein
MSTAISRSPGESYRTKVSRTLCIDEEQFEAYQATWFNMVSGWDWYAQPRVLPVLQFPMLHFVGFRDVQRQAMAELVFGPPDFEHFIWDRRAQQEVAPNDRAVFARGSYDDEPTPYTYDDSNQAEDPAALERRSM